MTTRITHDAYGRIIWSPDGKSASEVRQVIEQTEGRLGHVKLDRLFNALHGNGPFHMLNEMGVEVFYDTKIAEIPSKVRDLAEAYCSQVAPWVLNGMVDGMVSNMNFTNPEEQLDGLLQFSDTCREYDTLSCGVTVLTSKTAEMTLLEYHSLPENQVAKYARLLIEAGVDSIVCSPNEISSVKSVDPTGQLTIITPGVRPSFASKDDQARTMTPYEAVMAGADYLVIGRPITNGPGTPAENLESIAFEVQRALDEPVF